MSNVDTLSTNRHIKEMITIINSPQTNECHSSIEMKAKDSGNRRSSVKLDLCCTVAITQSICWKLGKVA